VTEVLSTRALSRATLARQLLLERAAMPVADALEHLVGLQAQVPDAPYVTLWSRLADFRPEALAELLTSRQAVRFTAMRGTLHLATAQDCRYLRPLHQTMLERGFAATPFAKSLAGLDFPDITAAGRDLVEKEPRTKAQLGPLLANRFQGYDPTALAYAVAYLLPTVQVTPRGVWGQTGPAALTTIEAWLGTPVEHAPTANDAVRRYLAAFGPATVADLSAWSGMTRLRDTVEAMDLKRYLDEDGRVLYDVPETPLPDPETPAPVRFLAEYDNVLLSHEDRSRVIRKKRKLPLPGGNGARMGTILVDGFLAGTWRISRFDESAALTVDPYFSLAAADRDEVEAEGLRLLDFVAPAHDHHFAIATRS
jgi:hypothetical protein